MKKYTVTLTKTVSALTEEEAKRIVVQQASMRYKTFGIDVEQVTYGPATSDELRLAVEYAIDQIGDDDETMEETKYNLNWLADLIAAEPDWFFAQIKKGYPTYDL